MYGRDSLAAIPVITRTDGTAPVTPLVSGADNYYEVELSRDGLWTVLRADETGKSGAILTPLYARRRYDVATALDG